MSTYRAVLVYLIGALFFPTQILAANQGVNTQRSSDVEKSAEKPVVELKRVKELGGEVVIDGTLRVLEPINGKVFDLVEVSTPVTPAVNHARIFLRADGTKQTLVILYDDGTIDNIATNQ